MIFKTGDLVKVLDVTSKRIFRKGMVLKSKGTKCRILMLDCDDIVDIPVNKIKKDC